jgi:hypothetical protein
LPHDPRHVPRGVDGRVPFATAKRLEVAVAIAAQVLRVGEEAGVRLAAREKRQLVPACERRLDERPAEELRSA